MLNGQGAGGLHCPPPFFMSNRKASPAALALSARGETRSTGDPAPGPLDDGHIGNGMCSISDGMAHDGGTTHIDPRTTSGDGGGAWIGEGWTDFGDGGSGIIGDGGTQVIGDGGSAG